MRRRSAGRFRWARWWPTILATVSLPRLAFACSGPGAMDRIVRNESLGWALWAVTVAIAGACALIVRRRALGRSKPWPLVVLVVVHPGWWMSARFGDCGHTLREGSILMTAVTLLVGGIMCWRAGRAPTTAAG